MIVLSDYDLRNFYFKNTVGFHSLEFSSPRTFPMGLIKDLVQGIIKGFTTHGFMFLFSCQCYFAILFWNLFTYFTYFFYLAFFEGKSSE